MCRDCVDTYDAVHGLPATNRMMRLVHQIDALYDLEGCSAGGPLHTVVDDYNLEDPHLGLWWHFWFTVEHRSWYRPDFWEVLRLSMRILWELKRLKIEQRAAVLAIGDGYLEVSGYKPKAWWWV